MANVAITSTAYDAQTQIISAMGTREANANGHADLYEKPSNNLQETLWDTQPFGGDGSVWSVKFMKITDTSASYRVEAVADSRASSEVVMLATPLHPPPPM